MNPQGARILITGGCGFIGSATAQLLLQEHRPAKVILLDDLSRGRLDNVSHLMPDPRLSFVHGDIRNSALLDTVTAGCDAVIHLAALRITACASDPRTAMEVMCQGSFNVLDAARRAHVKRVVVASSASVYGHADQFPTPENHHPWNNDTWYGSCKVLLEGLLRSFHQMYDQPGIALRYFNVYGERMDTLGKYTEVLVRWMERIAQELPPVIQGDGKQTLDFIHVRDVARANVAALQSEHVHGAFNVGSGVETSLNDLARLVLKTMGSRLEPRYEPARGVSAVNRRCADTQRSADLLQFQSRVGLEQGIGHLVTWWKQQAAQPQAAQSLT